MLDLPSLLRNFRKGEFTRVVAFGSSNTQRRLPGMHWFDCFDLACRLQVGPHLACINSGRGGDTAAMLLERIERDCLAYRPDFVILTVGGNDSNPERGASLAQFRDNLHRIIDLVRARGGELVLQTYYSFDLPQFDPAYAEAFPRVMQEVRSVANEKNCGLIDHLARWEPLRLRHPEVFQQLMRDPAHVNPVGNLLLGADILRAFGLDLPEDTFFHEARALQALLDTLASSGGREP